jgi:hypothetical protein
MSMVQYAAGQIIRANEINSLPQMYKVTTPQICNNSTAQRDITGLAFQADANASYLVECFLAYHATEAGDIKFAWTVPAGAAGGDSPIYTGSWWGVLGVEPGQAGGTPGLLDAAVKSIITDFHARSGDNSVPAIAIPVSYIQLGGTSGTCKLQFAQAAAAVHDTTIRVGSCMRVSRLS